MPTARDASDTPALHSPPPLLYTRPGLTHRHKENRRALDGTRR